MKKTDFLIVCILLLVSVVLFAVTRQGDGLTAEVTVNGQVIETVDLKTVTEDYDLTLSNGVILRVSPGAIAFVSSPCRGKDCVNCGALTRPGQSAACVPTKTAVILSGKKMTGAPDAIAY